MRLGAIIDRLRTGTGEVFVSVESARSLNTPDSALLPAAYVHPVQDESTRNDKLGGVVSQRRNGQFAVMIAAGHTYFDEDEDEWVDPLEDSRNAVYVALLGFNPFVDSDPIEYHSGVIVDVTADYILWRDIYLLADYLRSL